MSITMKDNVLTEGNEKELLDMNPIVKAMGNNVSGSSLRFSYSLPSSRKRRSNKAGSSIVAGLGQFDLSDADPATKRLMNEIRADMDPSSVFVPLNDEEVKTCVEIFSNYSVVDMCITQFEERLFEHPFQIDLQSDSGKELGVLQDSVRAIIVGNYWMPFLKKHFRWKKVFGIVPIFFEPVGLRDDTDDGEEGENKKKNRLIIHYVPSVPNFDAGRIVMYTNKKGRTGFVWIWNNCSADEELEFSLRTERYGWNPSLFSDEGQTGGEDVLSVMRSRYFFMHVIKEPYYSSGCLSSDIKSLVNEWRNIRYMEDVRLLAAQKIVNPDLLIEFHPDPTSALSGDSIDMAKLQIDILRLAEKGNAGGNGARNYSSEFGQPVDDAIKDLSNSIVADERYGVSNYRRISKERSSMLGAYPSVADVDLGLIDPSEVRSKGARSYGESSVRERMLLYAHNHPESPLSAVMNAASAGKSDTTPSNARYLNPYETVSGNGPKPSMPEFNIAEAKSRLDKLASAVCDFPLEMIMDKSGRTATDIGSDGTYQYLKDRLNSESKSYESLIKNLWSMSYLEFLENSRRKLEKRTKKTKNLDKIDSNSILLFENFKVTFQRTPFEGVSTFLEMYKMGIIDAVQFQRFVSDKVGTEQVDPKRMKEFEKMLEEYAFPPQEEEEGGESSEMGQNKKKAKKRKRTDSEATGGGSSKSNKKNKKDI